jgi:asparagine synthetase B (glutamine-hydrolysing)
MVIEFDAVDLASDSGPAPSIDVAIVDRSVERMDREGVVWFASRASRSLDTQVDARRDPVAQGVDLIRNDRDASYAVVDRRAGEPPRVHLFRGLFSANDWFVTSRSDGRIVVSDDFRSALAALPASDRTPNEDSVIQHYLFRTVFGTDTYVERVRRLGSGEHMTIELGRGTTAVELVDTIASEADLVAPELYLAVIEESLEASIATISERPDVRLSFSGGVDSTLLAAMMGPDTRLLTVVPDTPEFGAETEYARVAAGMLGMRAEEMEVAESSYVDLLEATIDATGRPPVHDVVPFLATPYAANPGATFVLGEGADGIYGIGGRAARIANRLGSRYVRTAMKAVTRFTPHDYSVRADAVIDRGATLAADPLGPGGYAAMSQVYGDPGFIAGIYGQERIDETLEIDLQYALDRVEMAVPKSPFYQHLEMAQWRDTFADHIRPDRDAARGHGVGVVAPFTMSASLSAFTRIPVPVRHVKGYTGKWLMKEMLAARLPAYPVGQRKRHTSLPFTRYCTDGPLTDIWDRYDPPDIFSGRDRAALLEHRHAESTLWNAVAFSVWEKRVVNNADLTPRQAVHSVTLNRVSQTR